jgi:hypothetical protein
MVGNWWGITLGMGQQKNSEHVSKSKPWQWGMKI